MGSPANKKGKRYSSKDKQFEETIVNFNLSNGQEKRFSLTPKRCQNFDKEPTNAKSNFSDYYNKSHKN